MSKKNNQLNEVCHDVQRLAVAQLHQLILFSWIFFLGCPIIAHQNGLERSVCLPFAAFGTKTYFPGLYHNVGDKVLDVCCWVQIRHRKLDQELPSWTSQQFFERCFFGAQHRKPSKNMAGPFLKWTKMKRATETAKKTSLPNDPCKSKTINMIVYPGIVDEVNPCE